MREQEKIKVLHCIPGFLYGGIESMFLGWYQNIDHENVQFDLLLRTQDENAAALKKYRALGGEYYRLESIHHFIKYYKSVKQFFKHHHNYDIVHIHANSPFVMFFAKKYGIKHIIIHSHTTQTSGIKAKLMFWIEKIDSLIFADRAFACSIPAAYFKFNRGKFKGSKVTIIHNAIDVESYKYNEQERERVRTMLGLSNEIAFVHVGRLTYQKNQFYLIDIFNELKKKAENSFFYIIGDGPDEDALKEYAKKIGISNQVVFLGQRDDVKSLLQAMDVFLLPSRYEGLPVTLVEAQFAGLPCFVASNITQEAKLSDFVFYMPIESSPKFWAENIIETYYSQKKYGRRRSVNSSDFDISKETTKLIEEYKNLIT